jgi:hypothetical protein
MDFFAGYLKASCSPHNTLSYRAGSALVADDVTIQFSQFNPVVQGHQYNMPNPGLRDIFVSLSHLGLCHVVEETLQPIADGALRDDGNHVRTVDHILGPVRRRHLSGHQGMVQRARSCDSLCANLAADAQCYSSCQRQYKVIQQYHHCAT